MSWSTVEPSWNSVCCCDAKLLWRPNVRVLKAVVSQAQEDKLSQKQWPRRTDFTIKAPATPAEHPGPAKHQCEYMWLRYTVTLASVSHYMLLALTMTAILHPAVGKWESQNNSRMTQCECVFQVRIQTCLQPKLPLGTRS